MSRRKIIDYIELSTNYIDVLDKQAEHYYEQCKILRHENKKLKTGQKLDSVHDETEQKLMEAAFKKLNEVDARIKQRD